MASYLGYPGTVGAEYMDYTIADKVSEKCEQQDREPLYTFLIVLATSEELAWPLKLLFCRHRSSVVLDVVVVVDVVVIALLLCCRRFSRPPNAHRFAARSRSVSDE